MPEAHPLPLYTAAQVRELDRRAIEDAGIPGYELMCRAGRALAALVEAQWPGCTRVGILCGAGNNGGDGYVLARLLRASGREVWVRTLADPSALRGYAAHAATDYSDAGGGWAPFDGELPGDTPLLVDALLGTGLDRPVEGAWKDAIQAVNDHPAEVLAVDIPSGLHADSGTVLGAAVEARHTLTFIGRKRGLYTGAGVHHSGRVHFDTLEIPPQITATMAPTAELMHAAAPLPPRRRDAHKGHFGHVLVVGGAPGMAGAVRLAAEAAARCGAGLVSVASHPVHATSIDVACREIMVHAVEDAGGLEALLARATVVVVGPGLGRGDWSQRLLGRLLDSGLPLVLDADALNLLAIDPQQNDDWILTPHPGEAARLLGCSTAEVQHDRFAAAQALASRYGGVVVLKGAGTLVASADGLPRVCAAGNPGMASGGMGDVLSGVLGALRAQGLGPAESAAAAVCLHGQAADSAAAAGGERGLLAGDLLQPLRRLVNGCG